MFPNRRNRVVNKFLPSNNYVFNNVIEFQNLLRTTTFATNKELFNYLARILNPKRVKIMFQYKDYVSEGSSTWNEIDDDEDEIIRVGISLKRNVHANSPFEQLCKGLIFEYPSWKQLTYPTKVLSQIGFNEYKKGSNNNKKFDIKKVLQNLNLYKIYPMYDGTVINLFFNKKWVISSTSGIELNDMKWFGKTTYHEAFFELLGEDHDNLVSTHAYTFVFKHKDFHPVDGRDYGLTLLHEFDIAAGKYVKKSHLISIPTQEELTVNEALFNTISHQIREGYPAFIEFVANIKSQHNFKKPIYGYIFRTTSDQVKVHLQNVSFETSLFQKIKKYIYNIAREEISECKIKNIPTTLVPVKSELTDRERQIILRSLMISENPIDLVKLCSRYNDEYTDLNKKLKLLPAQVMNCMTNKTIMEQVKTQTDNLSQLAIMFTKYLEKQKIDRKSVV